MMNERLRDIPSVDVVLAAADAGSSSVATDAVRSILAAIRADVRSGAAVPAFDEIVGRARAAILAAGAPSLRRVINATGVILQTNLGRAPLSERAIAAMQEA